MKYSFYNIIYKDASGYVLYNSLYDKVTLLQLELVNIIETHKNDIMQIKNIHPELYQYLVAEKYIINEEIKETEEYLQRLKEVDTSLDNFRLIVNPTLNCNLRCWYCYEEHMPNSSMSLEVIEKIKALLRKKINTKTKFFSLSFFGGEPLLKFKSIDYPLIKYSQNLCRENGVSFYCDFTTNAILLNKNVIDQLTNENINVRFQVPFDGGHSIHNSIKVLKNSTIDTYFTSIKNIKYALNKNIPFTIRCNYTSNSIDSFKEVINEFINFTDKSLINFSLQKIWQEEKDQELINKEKELFKYIKDAGYLSNPKFVFKNQCYADRENCILVNYNGDVYKCTANKFILSNKEGTLKDNGDIQYNDKYNDRLKAKYNQDICIKCKNLPICNVCSQQKMKIIKEYDHMVACDKKIMNEMVQNRIFELTNF